jgi:hypothetical protein
MPGDRTMRGLVKFLVIGAVALGLGGCVYPAGPYYGGYGYGYAPYYYGPPVAGTVVIGGGGGGWGHRGWR